MNNRTMYNSFHTALSRGSGRIEDACGESPAASLLWLRSLVEVQIIRSLFVHYSFIIRSYSCIMQTKPSQRHMLRYLGTIFGSLEGRWGHFGGLGGLLGSSWEVLGWSWGVLGRSWGGPGEVLGGLVAILGRHFEQSNFGSIF